MTQPKLPLPDGLFPKTYGRVFTDTAEYFWRPGATWTSKEDPERAKLLTQIGYGTELNSALPDAYENVLKHVASLFDGAKWEVLLPDFDDPNRVC